ncbi:MAG: YfhO family protein [Clostridia bacterium]|nr:YfhO family protein [Clostridia bacterium]
MEQVKNNKKKLLITCLITAGLAGVIYALFTAFAGIAPFGAESVIRNDALHQYVPFLADYAAKLKSGSSLLYSWTTGGTNEFGLIAYYLLSPFNLIGLFFNSTNADIGLWLIILLKTMCIGFTACFYFGKKFESPDLLNIAFALVYTFSGFYLAYHYNTMWLDALIMLPLIALGIENIVYGKKATLYFASLAYAIFVNFYLGYMICIFSVLYFFYLLFAKDVTSKEDKADELPIMQVLVKFGFASLLAGLICAVVILPVIYAIGNTLGRADFQTDSSLFNFLDFISFHLAGLKPPILETTTDTAPYAMSSVLTLLAVPAFFLLKNVKPNRKVATAVVLVLFYFSFSIPKMNYFWHGFSAPNGLPYRFVFIYLLFIITLAYEVVRNIKDVPVWGFGISAALAAAAIVYTKFTRFSSHFDTKVIVLSAAAAVLYITIMLLMKYKQGAVKAASAVLSVLIVAELIIGGSGAVASAGKYTDYYPYSSQIKKANEIIAADKANTLGRMEIVKNKYDIYNGAALYGYNGMSSFSSLDDSEYDMTQRMLGNEGNMFSKYAYYPQTPIYNAMFSMNYVLDADGSIDPESPFYEKLADIDGTVLYKVKYTLPVGFCADEGVEGWDPYNYLTLSVHNTLWSLASKAESGLVTVTPDDVEYFNCNAVDSKDVSDYINQRIQDGTLTENGEEEHDHEHEHEDEDEHTQAQQGVQSQESYELSAETLSEILNTTGDLYPFKATADGFSVAFNYTAKLDGEVFALVNAGSMKKLTVKRDGKPDRDISITERHISDIGYFKQGESYTLVVSEPDRAFEDYNADYAVTDSIQVSSGSVNKEIFLEGYNAITANGVLEVETLDDTYISGTVNTKKDCVMMMAMPYDLGWTVYVDGEETELLEHDSHIMMFELSKGEHTVELEYFPQGLKEGIFVSVAAVFGIALVLLLGKVHKMKLELEAEESAEAESSGADTENENPSDAQDAETPNE